MATAIGRTPHVPAPNQSAFSELYAEVSYSGGKRLMDIRKVNYVILGGDNAGVGDAHGVDHGDATLRHRFNRGAGRNRRRPGFRRRQILAHRHEAQREGRPDQPRLSRAQRPRSAPARPERRAALPAAPTRSR